MALLLLIGGITRLPAVGFSLKPYYGYSTVKMGDVNTEIINTVRALRYRSQHPLPFPGELNGSTIWGLQAEYQMEEDYFLNLSSLYYREKESAQYQEIAGAADIDYHFFTRIDLFEISVGIRYFFNYSSWKRINPYIGGNVGLGYAWSESHLRYDDHGLSQTNPVDTFDDVSSNAITAQFCAGITLRILPAFFLWGEVGARMANMSNMQGQRRTLNASYSNFTTPSVYDFSGFYLIAGGGFIIPFFK